MSSRPPASCSHELRPGTTVCLHCRRAARAAARARRRRLVIRVGGSAIALALVAALGVAGATSLQGLQGRPAVALATLKRLSHGTTRSPSVSAPSGEASSVDGGARASALHVAADSAPVAASPAGPAAEPAPVPAVPDAAPPPAPPAPLAPIVAEGETPLGDGIIAVRTGSSVAVYFDTPHTRTRRPDKFERIVRATLPEVYGPAADSLLAAIPDGDLARRGDLLTELTARGLHLAAAGGWTLALWPETRPGEDGPLVVTYRATVVR